VPRKEVCRLGPTKRWGFHTMKQLIVLSLAMPPPGYPAAFIVIDDLD
jgi:hypothetical protein